MSDIASDISCQVKKLRDTIGQSDCPIVAIAMVRDEADVIERFVRHAGSWADALLIVDHASCDDTSIILKQLVNEGVPLCVVRDDALGKNQSDRMTLLAKSAAVQLNARIIVPLDADEFMIDEYGRSPRLQLLELSSDAAISIKWRSYVPTPFDETSEVDVLKRIGHRLANENAGITKVIVGSSLVRQSSFRLGYGSHWMFSNTTKIMPASTSCLSLGHFPVRSAGQITAKVLLGQLSGLLDSERPGTAQEHYGWLREICAVHSYMSAQELQVAAERYGLNQNRGSADLVFDPVKDNSGLLRYTSQTSVDPAFRIEQFVRKILAKRHAEKPTALRALISDENNLMRAERDEARVRLHAINADYRKILGSRAARILIAFRRFKKWIRQLVRARRYRRTL